MASTNTTMNEQQRKLRSAEKFSSSPAASSSSVKLWEKIETRLEALTKSLTDSILSQLKAEIKLMHNLLSERLSAIENDFKVKIKSVEKELNDRLSSINHSVFSCKSRIDNIEDHFCRVDVLENELSMVKTQMLDNDNTQLKLQIDAIARKYTAGDLVLHGIPFSLNENLTEIFEKFCTTINLTPVQPNHILRTKPVKNSTNGAIIVKLPHAQIKTNILKRAAEYYKTNSKPVTLCDLGFDSNKFVRAYESLTKHNHVLFRRANELRQQKCLHSVFTRNGRVFVKVTPEKKPVCIVDKLSLESLCSSVPSYPPPTVDSPDVQQQRQRQQ